MSQGVKPPTRMGRAGSGRRSTAHRLPFVSARARAVANAVLHGLGQSPMSRQEMRISKGFLFVASWPETRQPTKKYAGQALMPSHFLAALSFSRARDKRLATIAPSKPNSTPSSFVLLKQLTGRNFLDCLTGNLKLGFGSFGLGRGSKSF